MSFLILVIWWVFVLVIGMLVVLGGLMALWERREVRKRIKHTRKMLFVNFKEHDRFSRDVLVLMLDAIVGENEEYWLSEVGMRYFQELENQREKRGG